jgi:hypothetical protein
MNKELGRKIIARIEKNPAIFDMDCWVSTCGTACCIAGHALLESGKYELYQRTSEYSPDSDWWFRDKITGEPAGSVSEIARELLDLTDEEYGNWEDGTELFFEDTNETALARLRELVEA